MNTFFLKIYTTEHPLYEGECESLIVPTSDGLYGVMAHHTDMIAAITDGELRYREKGKTEFTSVAVSPGILSVMKNEVIVLAETAEQASEIDFERAMKQHKHAMEQLEKSKDPLEKHQAQMKIARAVIRLRVGSKGRVSH